jgi:hypothetical protein
MTLTHGWLSTILARIIRSWSLAEDLTPVEIADGHKLLGRSRRMTPATYVWSLVSLLEVAEKTCAITSHGERLLRDRFVAAGGGGRLCHT